MSNFAKRVIAWQRRHGRHDLPWQSTRDPYRIWLSEVMLQQTQVSTVIPYFERFVARFPSVDALAQASEPDVLRLWSGLGYYARARNLHRAALEVSGRGGFPRSALELAELPGLGRSSAAAIAVFAFGERAAILDGNVKRVLARVFGIAGNAAQVRVKERYWQLAESLLPQRGVEAYTQGLMDLGATLCLRSRPLCASCPLAQDCVARAEERIAELPTPRARRSVPLRNAHWLVLRRSGRILLERRPPSGLWGGLWVFPESTGERWAADCLRLAGSAALEQRTLDPIEHAFSHFRLRAVPLLCDLPADAAASAQEAGLQWLSLADARDEALPAPVKRVLAALSVRVPLGPAARAGGRDAPGRRRARAEPASRRAAKAGSRRAVR
jgi:A/G-specific adenine glycosylase